MCAWFQPLFLSDVFFLTGKYDEGASGIDVVG